MNPATEVELTPRELIELEYESEFGALAAFQYRFVEAENLELVRQLARVRHWNDMMRRAEPRKVRLIK